MNTHAYLWFIAVFLIPCLSGIADEPTRLPSGAGLAAKYPQDRGIARDKRVLLTEDFETGTINDLAKRWESVSNAEGEVVSFSDSVPDGTGGKRSLLMTATLGKNTGGHLYRRLPREVDTLFARFYVKFADKPEYVHHFVHMGGYRPSTAWPQGGAGSKPKGDDRFTAGIEPTGARGQFKPPGTWNLYCYWPEMKISADNRYWGNGLKPIKPKQIPADTWQCVEVMLKLNSTPDNRDGELAFWIDGELQARFATGVQRSPWTGMGFDLVEKNGQPFEGFRWRTDERLKINFFWLLHYVTENAARQNRVANPNPTNRVWFDHIVLAEQYVGPMGR